MLPKTPLVVVSASENGADVHMALDHGASAVIPKSSSVQTMVSALRLVLAGGIYAPHALPPWASMNGPTPARGVMGGIFRPT